MVKEALKEIIRWIRQRRTQIQYGSSHYQRIWRDDKAQIGTPLEGKATMPFTWKHRTLGHIHMKVAREKYQPQEHVRAQESTEEIK